MSDIGPINPTPPSLSGFGEGSRFSLGRLGGAATSLRVQPDRVEFSDDALLLSKLHDLPVRNELVERVRNDISAGAYETQDKIEAAADSLLADLQKFG